MKFYYHCMIKTNIDEINYKIVKESQDIKKKFMN